MMAPTNDAMARKAQADLMLERAALQLHELLHEAAAELRPFPPFPGAFFTNAIEVDEGASGGPERGCVVVCEDGELYEFKVNIDFSDENADPVAARDEKLTKLGDLHPRDYVLLAYEALTRITEALMERSQAGA
jgi:hypothetical protein